MDRDRTCGHVLLLTLLIVASAGACFAAPGDSPEFTYRTGVSEVRLIFSATDQSDHGVATLQPNDFAIVDKGYIVRDYQSFSRSDWTKLDLAILIDSSESVTPRFRQEIAETIELISQTTGITDENLSLFTFQGLQPALVCSGNCRASHATDQFASARAGGLTPLFDAVVFTSQFLAQRGKAHSEKVLIVFSDGLDTISKNSLSDAIVAAQTAEVQVYSIDLGKTGSTQGAAILYKLSSATGGRYFAARDGATRALNSILDGFQASYTVSYRLPDHGAGFHTVQVLPTHNRNLQFRSRSGYYYPNQVR